MNKQSFDFTVLDCRNNLILGGLGMKVSGFLKTETARPKLNGTHLPLNNNNNNGHDLIGDNHVATLIGNAYA